MSLFLDPERKFFVVETFSRAHDSFVVAAILSKKEDAEQVAEGYRQSEKHCMVGVVQELTAEDIKVLLLNTHLGDLYHLLMGLKDAKSSIC